MHVKEHRLPITQEAANSMYAISRHPAYLMLITDKEQGADYRYGSPQTAGFLFLLHRAGAQPEGGVQGAKTDGACEHKDSCENQEHNSQGPCKDVCKVKCGNDGRNDYPENPVC